MMLVRMMIVSLYNSGVALIGTALLLSISPCIAFGMPYFGAVPGVPNNLSVVAVSQKSIKASWDAPTSDGGSAITSYSVQYRLSDTNANEPGMQPGAWHSWSHSTADRQSTITDLAAGTSYDVHVAAINADGTGSYTSAVTATTYAATVPGPVAYMRLVTLSTRISVVFLVPLDNGDSEITSYILEYRISDTNDTEDSDQPGEWINADGTVVPGHFLTGLTPDTGYDVQLAAVNAQGTGPYTLQTTRTTSGASVHLAPTNLTVTASSSTVLSVTWDPPSRDVGRNPIVAYTVEHRVNGSSDSWATNRVTGTSADLAQLSANTTYVVRVAAISSDGTGNYVSTTATTSSAATVPGKPGNFTIDALSPTTIRAVWEAPTNVGSSSITGYVFEHRVSQSSNQWTSVNRLAAAVMVEQLNASTTYEVRVAATNTHGIGDYATGSVTTPSATTPTAPQNLQVSSSGPTSLRAQWDSPTDNGGAPVSHYKVQYRQNDPTIDWTAITTTETNTTLTNLIPNVSYAVDVSAVNSLGPGPSSQVTATTASITSAPDAPINLTVTFVTRNTIGLSWAPPAYDGGAAILRYSVEHQDAGSRTWTSVERTGTNFTISGLESSTQYRVRVAAINTIGTGAYASTNAVTLSQGVPGAPSNVNAVASSPFEISVTWSAPSETGSSVIVGYVVQYRNTDADGDGPGIEPGAWRQAPHSGTQTGMSLSSLDPGTSYDIRVAATNAEGTGDFSAHITASTSSATVPSAVQNLTVTAVSQIALSVMWTEPNNDGGSPIVGYMVDYRLSDSTGTPGAWLFVTHTGIGLNAAITELPVGTAYDVRVAAFNAVGTGPYAEHDSTSTLSMEFEQDWRTLIALYDSTGGNAWAINTNWSTSSDKLPTEAELNAWHGITVDQQRVSKVQLSGNNLSGNIPDSLSTLDSLTVLQIDGNTLVGMLPRSLLELSVLDTLHFGGQQLCAPADSVFQSWVGRISDYSGPACATALTFETPVMDQVYPILHPITPVTLPEATGGIPPYTYTLTPALPAGLAFDSTARSISGIPTVATEAATYTYLATDAVGIQGLLAFEITVKPSGVSTEDADNVPDSFALKGNYPNPFISSTRIVFDSPSASRVTVEIFDLLGRKVLTVGPHNVSQGFDKYVDVSLNSAPAGVYLYRMIARLQAGNWIARTERMLLTK